MHRTVAATLGLQVSFFGACFQIADMALQPTQVAAAAALLEADNTVPFITRYRRDQTGGLDEDEVRLCTQ